MTLLATTRYSCVDRRRRYLGIGWAHRIWLVVARLTRRCYADVCVELAACPSGVTGLMASVATTAGVTNMVGNHTVSRRIATRVTSVALAGNCDLTVVPFRGW
jgi:hypothetical protein